MLGVERGAGFVAEVHSGHGLLVHRKPLRNAAGRIDGRRDAVVGGANQPAPIFRGPHAGDLEMLFARGAVAEVAVVRQIDQQVGALLDELPDLMRKNRFVADEDADAMIVHRESPRCDCPERSRRPPA